MSMRRLTLVLLAAILLAPMARPVAAQATTVSGGGQSTFDADLDGDGDVDGSYFGLALTVRGDAVEGHFVCAMWGNTDILDLAVMGVEGPVDRAEVRDGRVTFSGVGTVDLGTDDGFFTDVPFEVVMTEGGPGKGTLQLTVIGAFDGVPGDTIPGNNNYDLPVETVSNGFIEFD